MATTSKKFNTGIGVVGANTLLGQLKAMLGYGCPSNSAKRRQFSANYM